MSGYILAIIWVILTIINFIIFHMMFDRIYFGNPFKAMAGELFGSAVVGILEIAIGQMFLGGLFSLLGSLLSTLAGGALFLLRIILYLVAGAIIIFAVYMIAMFIKNKISQKDGESGQTAADAVNAVKNKTSDIKNKFTEKIKTPKAEDGKGGATSHPSTVDNQTAAVNEGSSDTKVCPNCGKKISATAKFCNFCGAKLTDNAEQNRKSESTEQPRDDSSSNDHVNAEPQSEHTNETDVQIDDIDQYIIDNFTSETKVQAIKCYREHTGLGLKEAKDKVDVLLKDRN